MQMDKHIWYLRKLLTATETLHNCIAGAICNRLSGGGVKLLGPMTQAQPLLRSVTFEMYFAGTTPLIPGDRITSLALWKNVHM